MLPALTQHTIILVHATLPANLHLHAKLYLYMQNFAIIIITITVIRAKHTKNNIFVGVGNFTSWTAKGGWFVFIQTASQSVPWKNLCFWEKKKQIIAFFFALGTLVLGWKYWTCCQCMACIVVWPLYRTLKSSRKRWPCGFEPQCMWLLLFNQVPSRQKANFSLHWSE